MNLSNKTLAFLGAGNMAEAIVRGLLKAGTVAPSQIIVTDVRPERLEMFGRGFGVRALADNAAAVAQADVVLLAVKPQQISAVTGAAAAQADKLFLSIAAGITTARLERELGGRPRVVRAMPNTPALVGAGAAAICPGQFATEQDLATAEAILRAVGICVRVTEAQMNAVTALSGSGPAYLFYFAESLIQAGIQAGLEPELARQLALQTVTGAAQLLGSAQEPPAELRRKVTSPGGTTEAAIRILEQRQFPAAIVAAVEAAAKRGAELAG